MIYIEKLDINFSISDLFLHGSKPSMEHAQLIRPRVHLILEKKSGKINLNEFIDRIVAYVNKNSTSTSTSTESSLFKIHSAQVVDGTFLLDDEQEKT